MTVASPLMLSDGATWLWVVVPVEFDASDTIGRTGSTPRNVATWTSAFTGADRRASTEAPASSASRARRKMNVRRLPLVSSPISTQPSGNDAVASLVLTETKATATSPFTTLSGNSTVKPLFVPDAVATPSVVTSVPPFPTATSCVRSAVCPVLSVRRRVTSWV